MSLSNLFDIPTAVDFLRGVLTTLSEFDQFQDDNFKPKMVLKSAFQFFLSSS